MTEGPDDDWAWRRWVRADPRRLLVYRVLVAVVGLAVLVLGLALVPLPGPGWVVVFVGLLILASEFEQARRVKDWMHGRLTRWNAWVQTQPLLVRAVIVVASAAFVVAVLWAMVRLSGLPGFLPDGWERWLHEHAAL